MMLNQLDVKKGMLVAVVDHEPLVNGPMFETYAKPAFNGRPLKIIEVCLPWIVVESTDGRVGTIDLRCHRLARVSKNYAKAWRDRIDAPDESFVAGLDHRRPVKRHKRRREKPDPRDCPRCGTRTVQRKAISADPKRKQWHIVCPNCDWLGGPVEKPK